MFSSLRMGGKLWFSYSVFLFYFLCYRSIPFFFSGCLLTLWFFISWPSRSRPGKGPRWAFGGDEGDLVHTMQNCRKWVIWCRLPDKNDAQRRGCCHQTGSSRQAFQGLSPGTSFRRLPSLIPFPEPWVADYADCTPSQHCRAEGVLLLKRWEGMSTYLPRPTRSPWMVLTQREQKDEVYLNLVLEFVPETVYRASRYFNKLKTTMPMLEVKLYIYQLFRSLAYIHSQGICHRDIKPQNLLLDTNSGILKLCDFGSAKILVENEPNVSYICSRYYRAPELIFGATNYTTKIGNFTPFIVHPLLLHWPIG